MPIKSQKSKLWYMTAGGALIRIQCFKNLSGLGGSRDQGETTCLDEDVRTYIAGLVNPGTMQFSIDPDPAYTGHKELHTLYRSGDKVDWVVGLSDGTSLPTTTQGVGKVAVSAGGTGYIASGTTVIFSGGGGTGAAATPVVENGSVVAIEVTNAGTGYASAPAVSFGLGVASVTITAGGSAYTAAPTVTFSAPPAGGTTATGTATIASGAVTAVTITNPGSGYTAAPTVTFSGGGGTGATATAVLGGTGATATATLKYLVNTPTDRTFLKCNGYVSDYPFDFQPGQPVTAQISVQLSDLVVPSWKV